MSRIIFIGKIRANNILLDKKQIRILHVGSWFFFTKFYKIFKLAFRALF